MTLCIKIGSPNNEDSLSNGAQRVFESAMHLNGGVRSWAYWTQVGLR